MAHKKQPSRAAAWTIRTLVDAMCRTDKFITARVGMAVNVGITIRNWITGFYIYEYEQRGTDRARYGERLLDVLSEKLSSAGIQGTASRTLRLCRQFYTAYQQIQQTLTAKSEWLASSDRIWQTLSAKSDNTSNKTIGWTASTQFKIPEAKLLERLSFSHFAELIEIDDPLKRCFYEIECTRDNWSVRELKRQISTTSAPDCQRTRGNLRSSCEKETAEPKLRCNNKTF